MYKHIIYTICLSSLVFILILLIKSLRTSRKRANVVFTLTALTTAVWIGLLWIADTVTLLTTARAAINLAVVCVSVLCSLFFIFAIDYPDRDKKIGMRLLLPLVTINVLFLIQALLGRIVFEVEITEYGASIASSSWLYLLHVLETYLLIGGGLIILRRKREGLNSAEVSRIDIMTAGITVAFIANILSGTLATYVQGLSWLNFVATASIVVFVGSIAYAILKHKLFDISSFIARSTGYVFTIICISLLYSFIILFVGSSVFGFQGGQLLQNIFYIVTALFIAFSLPSIKQFFDRLTNRIFYQDAYEPQTLLNDLNSQLVSTLDVNVILQQTSLLISHYIKPSHVFFHVRKNDGVGIHYCTVDISTDSVQEIVQIVDRLHEKLTTIDAASDVAPSLQQQASIANVSLVVKLNSPNEKKTIGAIVLGPKKSGNMYNHQDARVLEIIADEMVIAIQNALRFEEIQQFAETLQAKVDEATRKLRRTNEKLKALDETKDEFISMASHQLRTPLTSVKGYVSMVLDGDAGKVSKQQQKLLDQAFISSQRMVYLIADLLNVSRLRTGKFVIEAKPTNLADVIEGEVTQLVETAKGRDLTLSYHKPKDFPTLNLDETKTRQVIMNFIDNAIYYTPAGGHIVINLEDKGSAIEYTVVDDGIGVPKAEQHHLFSKFYRAGNAKKARPDGTGLGLFMAKKVIVAQGGSVIFRSDEGKGSTFGFSFPKAKLSVASATKTAEKPTKQQ